MDKADDVLDGWIQERYSQVRSASLMRFHCFLCREEDIEAPTREEAMRIFRERLDYTPMECFEEPEESKGEVNGCE
jgi:hypothetical protein